MTNAQNGVTMTARSHRSIGLHGGDATRLVVRLWHQATGTVMSYAVTPVVAWMKLDREMAELGRMGARELRDLGVNHGDFSAIRQGTFQRVSMLSAERVEFNPESMREADGDADPQPMGFFVPFAPEQNWYMKWWLGD